MCTKICKECKVEKSINDFYKQNKMRDGLSNLCKECKSKSSKNRRDTNKLDPRWVEKERNRSRENKFKYYRTENGLLIHKFSKMKSKSLERGHTLPEFTFEEFVKWCYENDFLSLFTEWKDNNYIESLSPSIDRINPSIGYVFENMRLITWEGNEKYNHYVRKNITSNKNIMSVKLDRLWGNSKFIKLSVNSKYLYVYLTTHKTINTAGVVSVPLELMSLETGLTVNEIRESSKELINEKYIYIKACEGNIYFIIPSHFATLPSNGGTVEKIKSDMAGLPDVMRDYLESIGITAGKKYKIFIKPSPDEIEQYCLSQGHFVNGSEVYEYYERVSKDRGKTEIWVDKNGTQVKDWKMKLKNVWCKPTNKLQKRDKAPKGFEYFFVTIDGKLCFPDTWKDGQPKSEDFTVNRALQIKFNKLK